MNRLLNTVSFLLLLGVKLCFSETIYLDANTFEVSGNGWKPDQTGYIARQATWQKVLHGADGDFESKAWKDFEIVKEGTYNVVAGIFFLSAHSY